MRGFFNNDKHAAYAYMLFILIYFCVAALGALIRNRTAVRLGFGNLSDRARLNRDPLLSDYGRARARLNGNSVRPVRYVDGALRSRRRYSRKVNI